MALGFGNGQLATRVGAVRTGRRLGTSATARSGGRWCARPGAGSMLLDEAHAVASTSITADAAPPAVRARPISIPIGTAWYRGSRGVMAPERPPEAGIAVTSDDDCRVRR